MHDSNRADCRRCDGTGKWRYDDNHAQPCPDCCPHTEGVWYLTFEYGAGVKRWCCKAGCGTTWAGIVDYQKRFGAGMASTGC